VSRTDQECSPASPAARADAPARTTWTDRIGQFNGGVFKSDQPRNYPLSKSTALCANTAFAYPYYILPILFPHKKSLGLSPAIFGIMQSVMHGVIVSRIAGDKYGPGFLASFFLTSLSASPTSGHSRLRKASPAVISRSPRPTPSPSRSSGRWPERRREEQEHPVLWTKEQTGPHDVEPA
jgi:hypothetical protein